eukprot:scaffold95168_cov59-Phaeocystis_antarctica.AAC.4
MHMPCICHAHAMHMPCICHAYATHIPVGSRPTGHRLHVPCTYHAYTMSHAPSSSSSSSQACCRSGLPKGYGTINPNHNL